MLLTTSASTSLSTLFAWMFVCGKRGGWGVCLRVHRYAVLKVTVVFASDEA